MSPVNKPGAILDPDHPEIGFDIMTGEWVFNNPIEIELKEKIIKKVCLKIILRDCIICTISGLCLGRISVLFGCSNSIVKHITLAGSLAGLVIGYFDKVENKILYNPLRENQ